MTDTRVDLERLRSRLEKRELAFSDILVVLPALIAEIETLRELVRLHEERDAPTDEEIGRTENELDDMRAIITASTRRDGGASDPLSPDLRALVVGALEPTRTFLETKRREGTNNLTPLLERIDRALAALKGE